MRESVSANSDEHEALRQANELFYHALETLDLQAMDHLWLHEGWVHCVHPGWEALFGWDAVRESWAQIFARTQWMRVTPTGVHVQSFGELGLVSCTENITAQSQADVGLAVAQATNLFRKSAQGWRMIHHHASPAPVQVTHPFSGTVQ
jgi:ketosteroid isomerase-like protein